MEGQLRFILENIGGMLALVAPLVISLDTAWMVAGVILLGLTVFVSSYQSKNMGGIWLATFAFASMIFLFVSMAVLTQTPY